MDTPIGKLHVNKEYREVMHMWQNHANEPETDSFENPGFSSPVLLNLLNQSPCVTWILDVRSRKFNFISTNTFDFFGYDSAHYLVDGQDFHEGIKHPDDTLNTWKLVCNIWKVLVAIPSSSRSNYKFSYDYRILKPDGKVARILEQNSVLKQDSNGNITHLLGVCNDITQWKRNGTQLASLTSVIDKKYFFFNSDMTTAVKPPTILSKRELEIVKLLSEGRSSKFIADKLFISFHTVNTHRQNMIEKTGTKNTGGLVQFVVCNGLI
ncbi:LuxR C-terminal-related transcriptional regulator [Dyadobacter frigoris]|uniref:HTH luxR-type domain-containing protein n=1 Tax=Dyadobacter frigoris TaxID=2576211 RepID=A0A4U6D6Q7_9BACT|nr:LuxR C-terminal-related transcriptional regulator [Dyadobacter frigoris]TKT91917.1 hypothetical protein FDK13_12270 [Dyadobacter frigoris]GLU53213.1 hypothetical protein Dfri01_26740 [Dyadobacter frigoris]